MSNDIDTAAIESLRTFAEQHGELAFVHLCTAALQGEEWAVGRMAARLVRLDFLLKSAHLDSLGRGDRLTLVRDFRLDVIRATDCTRPDGAIARSFQP